MRFKEWFLITEAGHFKLGKQSDLWVLYHGQPVLMPHVAYIDPRFEFMDIPTPQFPPDDPRQRMAQSKKFMGQFNFSLPLVGPNRRIIRWIVVPKEEYDDKGQLHSTSFMGGKPAYISSKPEGVRVPLDWADTAGILDDDLSQIQPTYGGGIAD